MRGPKHVVKRGKTPVLSEEQARHLLASIKITRTIKAEDGSDKEAPWLVGLRDRALIGVMVYSFARISAVVAMDLPRFRGEMRAWDQALWLYVMLSSGFVAFFGSAPGGAILPSRPAH